jgi:hypothetical protein
MPLQLLIEFRRAPGARHAQLLCPGCVELALDNDHEDSPNDAA